MEHLLAIDPGETVGYAWFRLEDYELKIANQLPCDEFVERLETWVGNGGFRVVMEDYKIRTSTVSANVGKELKTVKVIGQIEYLLNREDVPYQFQPAGIGKHFFDRKRMEDEGLWVKGKVHARDAIRHGMWHLMFGGEDDDSS